MSNCSHTVDVLRSPSTFETSKIRNQSVVDLRFKDALPFEGHGKLANEQREVKQCEKVILELIGAYRNTGRTNYCDNFLTTLILAEVLIENKLAIVGTVRSNKRFVPQEERNRPVLETLFGFYKDKESLGSYGPQKEQSRYAFVDRALHHCHLIEPHRKPNKMLDYNANRAQASTQWTRWCLTTHANEGQSDGRCPCFFLNILDVAGMASFVVYNHMTPQKQTDKRRKFQTDGVSFQANLCYLPCKCEGGNGKVPRYCKTSNILCNYSRGSVG